MIKFTLIHPSMTQNALGFLPSFFDAYDPRSAKEQIDDNYSRFSGGRWSPINGFQVFPDGLLYPGDPKMPLLAEAKLRDEVLKFYDCSWLGIFQPDGTYEISRVD